MTRQVERFPEPVMALRRQVAVALREQCTVRPGEALLVAVSGGADSVALLDLLANLPELPLLLTVAHLNHRMRGAEADADAAFVSDLAARYGLSCVVGEEDVTALARERRLSLEEAGREARHAFLREQAAALGAGRIALAHQADDQAETLLLRLLRGAGGSGLTGMGPVSPDGVLVRPLLAISRHQIEVYLRARGLAWREDLSNADPAHLRNRVRHELLPFLESYNPAIRDRLTTTATLLAADEALLAVEAERLFVELATCGEGKVAFAAAALKGLPDGLRRRILRRAVAAVKGDLRRLAFTHLQAIDGLLAGERPNAAVDLPAGLQAVLSYGTVTIRHNVPAFTPYELAISAPGDYPLPGGGVLRVTVWQERADLPATDRFVTTVDLTEAPFPWSVRSFRPGDRLALAGLDGRKKVKELFGELRLPRGLRCRVPLLCVGGTIFWVCGLRRGAVATATSHGQTAVVELAEFPFPAL